MLITSWAWADDVSLTQDDSESYVIVTFVPTDLKSATHKSGIANPLERRISDVETQTLNIQLGSFFSK